MINHSAQPFKVLKKYLGLGEILDRYTILKIKMTIPEIAEHVAQAYHEWHELVENNIDIPEKQSLIDQFTNVNWEIWRLEARLNDKKGILSVATVADIAWRVREFNAKRVLLKAKLNRQFVTGDKSQKINYGL